MEGLPNAGSCNAIFFHKSHDSPPPFLILEDKKISDFFDDNFWNSNFWLYWQTMFAFQRWSSALEMKRYLWELACFLPPSIWKRTSVTFVS